MILVDILIENYKQYAGSHHVPIPAEATVGIIGANGVGKTTLFEAIEWCLYNPRAIGNDEVRPRGRAAHTKVAVTMDRPETGERFIVERTLKRAGVTATIYRVEGDGSESVVVQGTRQVSDYVATRLIGLSHGAFVSTFFTRQKELSFFGHLKDTDRRREVGRLLGLETIRAAQEAINEERKQAKAEAESLRRQHEDQSQGRDFAAEREAAERDIVAAENELSRAGQELEAATARHGEASRQRAHWQELKDQDTALHRNLIEVDGKLSAGQARSEWLTGELGRLTEREREQEQLRPLAGREPELSEAVRRHETERGRYEQQRRLHDELKRIAAARTGHAQVLQAEVLAIELTEPIEGWNWSDADVAAPIDALARLQATLAATDLSAAECRAEVLQRCQEAAKAHRDAGDTFSRYFKLRQQIDDERQELLAGGDPREALREYDEQRQQAQVDSSNANARAKTLQQERGQIVELLDNLRRSSFGDLCPTCARPFSSGDARLVIESLEDRRESVEGCIAHAQAEGKAAQVRQRELVAAQKHAEERVSQLQTLLGRLEASEPYLREQRTKQEEAEAALATALREAGMETPPPAEHVVRATARARLYRTLTGCTRTLTGIEKNLRDGEHEQEAAKDALVALGKVDYDAAAHVRSVTDLQGARDAQATLAAIDRELVRRPALEQERASCRAEQTRLTEEREANERARQALGFDAAAMAQAVTDEEAARAAERAALEARHTAQTAHRDAHRHRDALCKEHERIAQLATRADTRQRDADQLDLMVREFTAFDQYVAARYAPILAETTSELVGQITDGKYDRIEYDENYGIDVYEGDDEKFPLATFSGGERDAIALCARLALSRMVGSQAVSPPGFLVLDEVFGSLDRDRRARLLEMLGSLAGATEHFHQLFVISHVDDVQGAAIFDELWRIDETVEGASQIVNATRSDGIAGDA